MHVHKNDTVLVISGNAVGKQGKVLKVFPDRNRVIIENVNIVKRHARPNQKNPQGGLIDKEGSFHVSNVMLVCGSCEETGRVAHKLTDEGKSVRVCPRCNADIDKG